MNPILLTSEGGDSVVVHFYDDQASPEAQVLFGVMGVTHHREIRASDRQMVALEFRHNEPQPLSDVAMRFDQVCRHLPAADWVVSSPVEGLPKTGCSIDGLNDLSDLDSIGDGKTASGFTVVAERQAPPCFRSGDVAELTRLVGQLGEVVFGRPVQVRSNYACPR